MKLPTLEADKDKIMSKEQNLEDKDKALHIGVVRPYGILDNTKER